MQLCLTHTSHRALGRLRYSSLRYVCYASVIVTIIYIYLVIGVIMLHSGDPRGAGLDKRINFFPSLCRFSHKVTSHGKRNTIHCCDGAWYGPAAYGREGGTHAHLRDSVLEGEMLCFEG